METVKIYKSQSLQARSYLTIYIGGRRTREYNGKAIAVDISPNRAHSVAERDYLLELLKEHYVRAIESGDYSIELKEAQKEVAPSNPAHMLGRVEYTMKRALEMKALENRAEKYYRNLKRVTEQFLDFLDAKERSGNFESISKERVSLFLARFNTSETYYMNKRRHLLVILQICEEMIGKTIKCAYKLPRSKGKAKNHEPYSTDQMRLVFNYLAPRNHNLYVCCLLMYSCWLRPHREIRNLTVRHFREGFTRIRLAANENKSGVPRTVVVPELTANVIKETVREMNPDDNIFTGKPEPFNEDYFSKLWERMKKKMLQSKVIQPGQTLYSFRHTAAIGHYRKHRDVVLLRKVLGHADVTTTMTYLKHLGELSDDEMKMSTPDMSSF